MKLQLNKSSDLWNGMYWEYDSLAVVACDGHSGCVIWAQGPHLRVEIEEHGLRDLADLGLDDAPHGISVWEGRYVWHAGSYEYPLDGSSEPSGKFRAPTDAEWMDIRAGRNPWPEDRWRITPAVRT